jgi:hypothetical protein
MTAVLALQGTKQIRVAQITRSRMVVRVLVAMTAGTLHPAAVTKGMTALP